MKALFLAPESPYPSHGGGAMRSASTLEWLARRADVSALVCSQHALPAIPPAERVSELCRRVEVVELPCHSRAPLPRLFRNLSRVARRIPPLVDRFYCPQVEKGIRRVLKDGPFDLAVFEHFWMAPWIRLVRPQVETAILNLHNGEAEFYRALGGPLAGVFAESAARWERELLPKFDQVWTPFTVPTGLPWRDISWNEADTPRDFDLAFSASWDYPPNRDGLLWFFRKVWPEITACRPGTRIVLIGCHDEAIPAFLRREPQVTITGPVLDASDWLGRARIAIAPLRRGAGVSVKIAEAWRAGCAVVTTSVGARGYEVEGQEGLVVVDHPNNFATSALELLVDGDRRLRLARAGRRRFEQEYTWSTVHDCMEALSERQNPQEVLP